MSKRPRYLDRHNNEHDEREAFDSNGVLRDGFSIRVPLHLADAARRRVPPLITDGRGDDAMALHRPGFRIRTDDGRQAVADAYADYETELCNAWRGADAEETWGTPGDQCTVREGDHDAGNPGHLHRINGRLICVPDAGYATRHDGKTVDQMQADHRRRMRSLYDAHDAEFSDMWRQK